MLTIGSLFSGIGGLELGLEWAGLGPVKWQVEIDPFCRQVLAKHWPEVQRFEDVRAVGAEQLAPVDLICGGFPCQDVSSAGKRAGLAGSRSGLWREYARVVREVGPQWVVVENVSSGARLWVDSVSNDLEQLGYEVLPVPLSAANVGAPHLRRRVFVVAHSKFQQLRHELRWSSRAQGQDPSKPDDPGEPWWVANPELARLPRPSGSRVNRPGRASIEPAPGTWSNDSMPEPTLCRVDDGPAAWVDRNERLRALGNAVVPQCAEVIGWVIRELAGLTEAA